MDAATGTVYRAYAGGAWTGDVTAQSIYSVQARSIDAALRATSATTIGTVYAFGGGIAGSIFSAGSISAIYAIGGGVSATVDTETLSQIYTTGALTGDVTVTDAAGQSHCSIQADSIQCEVTVGGTATVVTNDAASHDAAGSWGWVWAQGGNWWLYASNGAFGLSQRVYTRQA